MYCHVLCIVAALGDDSEAAANGDVQHLVLFVVFAKACVVFKKICSNCLARDEMLTCACRLSQPKGQYNFIMLSSIFVQSDGVCGWLRYEESGVHVDLYYMINSGVRGVPSEQCMGWPIVRVSQYLSMWYTVRLF